MNPQDYHHRSMFISGRAVDCLEQLAGEAGLVRYNGNSIPHIDLAPRRVEETRCYVHTAHPIYQGNMSLAAVHIFQREERTAGGYLDLWLYRLTSPEIRTAFERLFSRLVEMEEKHRRYR
ncbi:hypothetical protein JW930_02245 [Candidatus Woesearchaeota archaeon]|nr:hypothetical protein [Candidatus Woesearchaeota archaeon]